MAMTRKHYRQFAEAFKEAREDDLPDCITDASGGKHYTLGWLASRIGTILEDDNERFDHDKFLEACFQAEGTDK